MLERVGAGGMATVYRARDERLKRDVAIKVLALHLARNPRFVRRFRREAEVGAGARTEPQARASATTIQVGAKEFSFKLSAKSIARPGKVTFAVKNNGDETHDFSINGKQTKILQPGTTAKLAVSFTKAGRYRYLCTVPGHAAMGMRGVFTVR